MITKSPPEVLTPEDLAYISTLNECERRQFLSTKAIFFHKQGFSISKVSKIMRVSKNTVYKGIRELRTGNGPGKGRVRRQGGGRKELLSRHPEWIDALKVVIEPHTVGLPQDADVLWVSISVPQISKEMSGNVGYMTIGTSHDTSKFVCDNIYRVWKEHLQHRYSGANTLVLMCDGGGSNSSSHRIVKQDLLNMSLMMYCEIGAAY